MPSSRSLIRLRPLRVQLSLLYSGRHRNHSAPNTSFPISSSFRRLPSFGKTSFRKSNKVSSPAPQEPTPGTPDSDPVDGSGHQRTSTLPSASRALADGNPSSANPFFVTGPAARSPSPVNPQQSQGDPNGRPSPAVLVLPSRTSSLLPTPSALSPAATENAPNPNLASSLHPPLSPFPPSPLPPIMAVQTALPALVQPYNTDSDLETISYPSHLAELQPLAPRSIRPTQRILPSSSDSQIALARDASEGSRSTIILGAVHDTDSLTSRGSTRVISKQKEYTFQDELAHSPSSSTLTSRTPSKTPSTQFDDSRPAIMEWCETEYEASAVNTAKMRKEAGPNSQAENSGRNRLAANKTSIDRTKERLQGSAGEETGTTPSVGPRERERSRKPSGKAVRSQLPKVTEPVFPANRGIARSPGSAMYFSSLPTYGRPPGQALRAHTGTLVGERIWFLGGVDGKHCWRGVAWLDTESSHWSTIETFGESLPPLRAHSTTLVGDRLYIFGGGDGPTYSNDVWALNTVNHRFYRPDITTPRSQHPLPRRAHTTVLYRNFLVVFGGGNGQAALNDCWALDVSDPARLSWHEWRTKGDVPQRKGYHTANLVGDKMVVFGGSDGHASFADIHVLNLQTLVWTLVDTEVQHNRLSHTSTQVGSYLFVLGGHNGETYAQDVLLFNLVTLQWESKTPRGAAPPGRGYHVALLHDARIFISGGYNGVSVFDDLWVIDLSAGAYLPQVTTFVVDELASART